MWRGPVPCGALASLGSSGVMAPVLVPNWCPFHLKKTTTFDVLNVNPRTIPKVQLSMIKHIKHEK